MLLCRRVSRRRVAHPKRGTPERMTLDLPHAPVLPQWPTQHVARALFGSYGRAQPGAGAERPTAALLGPRSASRSGARSALSSVSRITAA